MTTTDNNAQIIDSRDLIARIEELESDRQALEDDAECIDQSNEEQEAAIKALADWDASEEAEELKSLRDFAEEASQYSADWTYGETLINESYWVEYVEELVKDIGDMPREIPSYIEIDWEKTAQNISQDYTTVSFDGTDFYIRNC